MHNAMNHSPGNPSSDSSSNLPRNSPSEASLLEKLNVYQAERFPLKKTVPLLAVFSAASVTVSANLANRELPSIAAYLIGFAIVFIVFFQMRVCDEVKDGEDDKRYRPERPVPRGLISLQTLVLLGVGLIPVAMVLAWLWGNQLVVLLLVVWVWLFAMTVEFGAPVWLKARPVVYLLSHMTIMPLIDFMLTGIEWLPSGAPHPALWLFIALSFTNGCVLELGRKLWAPENEINGVETYSKLWGVRKAALVWSLFVALSLGLLLGIGIATEALILIAPLGTVGAAACYRVVHRYVKNPTPTHEKSVDTVAGLWVFLCYASAGFAPLLVSGL